MEISLEAYRQALRLIKTQNHIIFALCAAVIALCSGYAWLFPLKEKSTEIYEFVPANMAFVRISKADDELTARTMLIAATLRNYVVARELIDHTTESERYPAVVAMSSDTVTARFKELYGRDDAPAKRKDFKRNILVNSDSQLSEGVHQVEFVTDDSLDGRTGKRSLEWIATIAYEFRPQEVKYSERFLNPLGIFVTEYTLAARKHDINQKILRNGATADADLATR